DLAEAGKPAAGWGGVGGGGRAILSQVAPRSSRRITPRPTPPPQGGREQTEFAARSSLNAALGGMVLAKMARATARGRRAWRARRWRRSWRRIVRARRAPKRPSPAPTPPSPPPIIPPLSSPSP